MEPNTFDAIARSVGSSASRRSVVSAIAVGLAALVLPREETGARRGRRDGARGDRAARDHSHGHPLEAEKKKKRKGKKKHPVPCASQCAGKACGPNGCGGTCGTCAGNQQCQNGQCVATCTPACGGSVCGADGCGGACGSCGSGESCENGACVPLNGSCSPACVGGQVCQSNGTCVCPAATPIFHSGLGLCMECNLDSDCGNGSPFSEYQCRHDRGHTCHCWEGMVDCGEGYCSTCCTKEDCLRLNNWSDGRMFCSAPGNPRGGHLCLCPEGLVACSDETVYCTDLHTDSYNCGYCGNVCHSGTRCIDRDCRLE